MKNLKFYKGNLLRTTEYNNMEPRCTTFGFGISMMIGGGATSAKEEVVKENVELLSIGNSCYVDITKINNIVDVLKCNRRIGKDGGIWLDDKWILTTAKPFYLPMFSGPAYNLSVSNLEEIDKKVSKRKQKLLEMIRTV